MGAGAPGEASFTCTSARSAAITGVLVMLLVVETAGLHFLLWRAAPPLAWGLTALSLYALWWIVDDYRALGRVAVRVDAATIEFTVGRRLRATIARGAVASVTRPTWQEIGASAPPHLNATKPATPNVLIIFTAPQTVLVMGVVRKPIARLSLHLDDPAGFLNALAASSTPAAPPSQ